MNLSTVKSIVIPEGNATSFSIGGVKVWSVPQPSGSPWDEVAAAIADGTYKTKYKIGDMVPLDLGSEGLINMQIAAFDTDALADGSGTAAISWVAKELLKSPLRMNPAYVAGTDGTGAIGGWEKCELRTYLRSTIKQLIPQVVLGQIVSVFRTQNALDVSGTQVTQTTSDDLWIPASPELIASGTAEYVGLMPTKNDRKKKKFGSTSYAVWWLRNTGSTTSGFYVVGTTGATTSTQKSQDNMSICLGFCTGRTQT